jgi:hypothetical protein
MYRYPKETSDDLIYILNAVSDRLWIPYQVALEYQNNRLRAIRNQIGTYHKVQEILTSTRSTLEERIYALQLRKRHSSIDPSDFLGEVGALFDDYSDRLEDLKRVQPDVHHSDKLRDEIDALFSGKVGPPPDSQEELDSIYEEGRIRYGRKHPPGYMDQDRNKELEKQDEPTTYLYGGLIIERKYGDLILWKQIIKEARTNSSFKHIIFVTDEVKEDWWWKAKRSGSRRVEIIGPRPELSAEIASEANVEMFHMYQSDTFMIDAEKYLGIRVREESVNQVRDISQLDQLDEDKRLETVLCPECEYVAATELGTEPGSSAGPLQCASCGESFHVHRRSDGSVFTRLMGVYASDPVLMILRGQGIRLVPPEWRPIALRNLAEIFEETPDGTLSSYQDLDERLDKRLRDEGQPSDLADVRKVRRLVYRANGYQLLGDKRITLAEGFNSSNINAKVDRTLIQRIMQSAGLDIDADKVIDLLYDGDESMKEHINQIIQELQEDLRTNIADE